MDGNFAIPGDCFGCLDFEMAGVNVDRTILVTVFPRELIGLKQSIPKKDCICPDLIEDGFKQGLDLLRLATQPSEPSELLVLYNAGYSGAEKWCRNEERRSRSDAVERIKV